MRAAVSSGSTTRREFGTEFPLTGSCTATLPGPFRHGDARVGRCSISPYAVGEPACEQDRGARQEQRATVAARSAQDDERGRRRSPRAPLAHRPNRGRAAVDGVESAARFQSRRIAGDLSRSRPRDRRSGIQRPAHRQHPDPTTVDRRVVVARVRPGRARAAISSGATFRTIDSCAGSRTTAG